MHIIKHVGCHDKNRYVTKEENTKEEKGCARSCYDRSGIPIAIIR